MTCLLCNSPQTMVAAHFQGTQLRALWKGMGHGFSDGAWDKIAPQFEVELCQCTRCGFTFFDPALAGNEMFYRELEHKNYFCPSRPEFATTLNFIRQRQVRRILDVGCGSGAFLDMARQSGYETYGLELNQAAAEKARVKGHVIYQSLLHELDSEKTSGTFDLITLFQVLEHVSDPVGVIKQAAAVLRPGGFISIAVPSADGVYRLAPLDPHQWPPHHISRWRHKDFVQLAHASGLNLFKSGGDILLGSEIKHLWELHNRLAPLVGCSSYWGGKTLPAIISLVYRKTGMKYLFPHWGNSIYGFFQKSELSANHGL